MVIKSPADILKDIMGDPVEEHTLVYDSAMDGMEAMYFWILDKSNELFGNVEKLADNFASSPGSGHFSELGAKATRMQEEAMKILGGINQVIKSILNLLYDLKEFDIRLQHYEASKSKEKEKAEAGLLSLKQIWMDSVDMKKGIGSINQLSRGELMFSTLRDAFLIVKSPGDVDKLDLNDRVKRILKPRIAEFNEWVTISEAELKKRFEIEKAYLRSQVSSLRMYTRWARPYLKAAAQLEMKSFKDADRNPDLVTAFNTLIFELVLFGKKEIKPEDAAIVDKTLPLKFASLKFKRKYYSCVLLEFDFRGIPQRVSQQQAHYSFGGKTTVRLRGYAMNDDEIALFNNKVNESDIYDAFEIAAGVTDYTIDQIKEDLKQYVKVDEIEEEEEEKSDDVNPFAALFSSGEKKKAKIEDKDDITKDNYYEKVLRKIVIQAAREGCFNVYDIYKKTHDMASFTPPTEYYTYSYDEAYKKKEAK